MTNVGKTSIAIACAQIFELRIFIWWLLTIIVSVNGRCEEIIHSHTVAWQLTGLDPELDGDLQMLRRMTREEVVLELNQMHKSVNYPQRRGGLRGRSI